MKIHILKNETMRRILAISSLFILVSCGAEDRANRYLEKANDYYAKENYQKAKVEIKNVLQINPKNSQARVILAKINLREGEFRQSFQNLTTAAEEDPNQIDARVELIKIYLSGRKPIEAKNYLDQLLKIDPNNLVGRGLLAGYLLMQEDRDAASVLAKEVLASDPRNFESIGVLASIYVDSDPEYVMDIIDAGLLLGEKNIAAESNSLLLLKIEVLKKLNRIDDIAEIYNKLIKDKPVGFKYYDSLATLYLKNNQLDKAKSTLIQAIKYNPDSIAPVSALVSAIKLSDGSENAIKEIKKHISEKPEVYEFRKILVGLLLEDKNIEEAKSILKESIKQKTNAVTEIAAKTDLANIYMVENNLPEVEKLLADVLAQDLANTDALVIRAKLRISEKKYKDAIADLRSAIKNEPNLHEAFRLLAVAQEQDGSPELALDSYYSALEINANDDLSLINAARLNQEKGDKNAALKLIQRLVELQPFNVIASEMLISIYMDNSDWNSSQSVCEKFINREEPYLKANGYSMLGKVMARQKKWQEAELAFERSRSLSPKSFAPLVGQINSMLAQNKTDQSISIVERYTKDYTDSVDAQRLLANLYHKYGKTDSAILLYQELIKQHPEDAAHYQGLAGIYLKQNMLKEAEATLLISIEKSKEALSTHILIAGLYINQKRYTDAEKQYQTAHQLAPENMLVRNNLSVLLVNHFASESNIQKSMDLVSGFAQSSEPVYLDTLGWVQYKAGNLPQSISYLQKAISLKDNPEFRYHLGVVYEKSGQKDQAKRELDLAIKQATGNEDWLADAQLALTKL
jgi:tetratricopeptide (TPR) repeat protein